MINIAQKISNYGTGSVNDIEIVQKILEGRCLECDRILPEHEATCSDYPVNILTNKMSSIKHFVSERQQRIKDIIESIDDINQRNEELRRFIEEYIEKDKHV